MTWIGEIMDNLEKRKAEIKTLGSKPLLQAH
jgi:hypothetical protein